MKQNAFIQDMDAILMQVIAWYIRLPYAMMAIVVGQRRNADDPQ